MNAVSYMRYSSHGQKETSIDGQRAVIKAFAEKNGINIVSEYIDRALTGTSDKRPQFNKMINDSARHQFSYVLIYSTDRFARNRYDSATYKAKLKKNNVRVLSATENITDDPAGIMVEGVLESMAEYFSAELSQKVKRGISLSIEQCKFIGGFIPLGFTVDENKRYQIDPVTAPVVQKIFSLYAAGNNNLKLINEEITAQFGKSFFGNPSNSINRILDNRNYIGIYTRGGADVKGGMPQIISDEIFERVQMMRQKDKKTPAKARAHEEYLLTTKLFCGYHGREPDSRVMMVGVSGTSKSGKIYNYYSCKSVWKKLGCNKKPVHKAFIEDFILEKAREQLTDENIDIIAKTVCEISKAENNTPLISETKRKLKDNAAAIENLLKAIESGEHMELLSNRITQKKQEKAELEKSLAREQMEKTQVDEDEIKFFLSKIRSGDIDDIKYKRALIAIFINAVYLYDDRATIFFNAIDKTVEFDYNLLNDSDIESEESSNINGSGCSYIEPTAPPFCDKSEPCRSPIVPVGVGFGFIRWVWW